MTDKLTDQTPLRPYAVSYTAPRVEGSPEHEVTVEIQARNVADAYARLEKAVLDYHEAEAEYVEGLERHQDPLDALEDKIKQARASGATDEQIRELEREGQKYYHETELDHVVLGHRDREGNIFLSEEQSGYLGRKNVHFPYLELLSDPLGAVKITPAERQPSFAVSYEYGGDHFERVIEAESEADLYQMLLEAVAAHKGRQAQVEYVSGFAGSEDALSAHLGTRAPSFLKRFRWMVSDSDFINGNLKVGGVDLPHFGNVSPDPMCAVQVRHLPRPGEILVEDEDEVYDMIVEARLRTPSDEAQPLTMRQLCMLERNRVVFRIEDGRSLTDEEAAECALTILGQETGNELSDLYEFEVHPRGQGEFDAEVRDAYGIYTVPAPAFTPGYS